jgi:hypothetical protein
MNSRNSLSDVNILFHPDDDLSHTVNVFARVGDEDVYIRVYPTEGGRNIVQENVVRAE